MVISQDSLNKPSVTAGYKYGPSFRDSAMLYPWGLQSKKAVVDTLKTTLSGRRYFGNQQQNIYDTILVTGVAESTTVVTVSYGRDTKAASWNAPQAWVSNDTIFVKRRAITDPNNYYWRAEKVISASQIQPSPVIGGVGRPDEPDILPIMPTRLEQSFPNPAGQKATISYQTAKPGRVSLVVYNMLGQKVKLLVDQPQPAGSYSVQWDGRNQQGQSVSSGIYFYELKTEETQITKKLVLAR
jgi:hypothetical protein